MALSNAQLITELYVGYYNRAPDPAGLNFWLSALDNGTSLTTIADDFANSSETIAVYPFLGANSPTSTSSFVTSVYQNILNRAPDAAGLAFWTAQLQSGSVTSGSFIVTLEASVNMQSGTADALTLANKTTIGLIYEQDLSELSVSFTQASAHDVLSGVTSDPSTVAAAEAKIIAFVTPPVVVPPPIVVGPQPVPLVALTVPGDTVHLNTSTSASTVTFTGSDLTAYPAPSFGTLAALVGSGVTSVTDTGGSFTLDASGNSNATTFDFGSGVVSGTDAASSAGITYAGVTTYITSANHDTVTLSAGAQNVTASNDGNTINLGVLAFAGTLNLNAGSGGTDTINASVGGDLSAGTISGTGGKAHIALVLSAAGAETLNTAEYNAITSTTAGSITFAGGAFGTNTIAFSNSGSVTAISNVGNYRLSSTGNTIALNNIADNVAGEASGNDTVNLAALTYTGAIAFGAAGSDSVAVTVGGNISGASISSTGATVGLTLSGSGTETLSTGEYNTFTNITGGTFGGDTIAFSNAGTVTANANVGNYILSNSGNTITLTNVADNVAGAASGSDLVNLAALTYAGTTAFGAAGSDSVHVTISGNISGGTITTGGATVALVLSGSGTETLNTAEYNLFNATSIAGGTFGGDTIAFSNAGTVTANANVGNYDLSSAGNTITLDNVGDNVTGASSGNDVVNLAALTYTGITAFGASGSDSIHVTVGGDISGGTVTSGGAAVGLVLSGAGSETLSTAEYNLFNATSITGGAAGSNTVVFANAGTVADNADVGNYHLSTAGNSITLTSSTDNVTGAASGNDIVAIPQFNFAGTLAFGASGTDIIKDPTNGDFSGLSITSSGATLELMITGVASGVPSGSTTTTEVYDAFTTGSHAGGIVFPAGGDTNPTDYIIAFSDQGTVTDSANITNYYLNASVHSTINDIYTFTVNNNGADNITEFSAATGGSTFNINVSTFTGSLSLGSSGTDTVSVAAGNDISGGQITSSGTAVALAITGSGTVTVSSAEAALFHAAPSAVAAGGTDTLNIVDATSPINLDAHENALTTVGLQAGSNTVNVSIGAASVSAGAAGFNQTISENGAGSNTFNVNNGAATITGASDASHYLTINNFNTASDNVALTLSGVAQNAGEQDVSDSGNDTFTVANHGVVVLLDLGALPGFTLFNATDLSSAAANLLRAVNASTATTGEYSFVVDSNQGAAIYEAHVNSGGSTIDGIQLIGVIHGVGAFNLVGHIA